jgi:hypothetical protein
MAVLCRGKDIREYAKTKTAANAASGLRRLMTHHDRAVWQSSCFARASAVAGASGMANKTKPFTLIVTPVHVAARINKDVPAHEDIMAYVETHAKSRERSRSASMNGVS